MVQTICPDCGAKVKGEGNRCGPRPPAPDSPYSQISDLTAELKQAREELRYTKEALNRDNEHADRIEDERDALAERVKRLEEVEEFALAMLAKKEEAVRRHPKRPHDPWNQYPTQYLRGRLREEFEEWLQTTSWCGEVPAGAPVMESGELLDVANFCWFIWRSLRDSTPVESQGPDLTEEEEARLKPEIDAAEKRIAEGKGILWKSTGQKKEAKRE